MPKSRNRKRKPQQQQKKSVFREKPRSNNFKPKERNEDGQTDISKFVNFTHEGVLMAMTPDEHILWGQMTSHEKHRHAMKVKQLIAKGLLKIQYKTFENAFGIDETKYYYTS